MKFILGRKLNMSQIYDASGAAIPVTLVVARGNTVTQVRTKALDGYEAVQVGEGTRNANRINKAQKGHFKDLGSFAALNEFRVEAPAVKVGDKIELSQFKAGDVVTVSAISKGKGFQGVVKRHGFGGGPRSHGQKHSEREPGSISGGTREGGRVPKGMRMGGRMGSNKITIKGLNVVAIDKDNSIIYIKGAVPGRKGTLLEIKG
jgi:large subunit ribosomal protein L3